MSLIPLGGGGSGGGGVGGGGSFLKTDTKVLFKVKYLRARKP